jgi:uncharacterized membrane protein YgcG
VLWVRWVASDAAPGEKPRRKDACKKRRIQPQFGVHRQERRRLKRPRIDEAVGRSHDQPERKDTNRAGEPALPMYRGIGASPRPTTKISTASSSTATPTDAIAAASPKPTAMRMKIARPVAATIHLSTTAQRPRRFPGPRRGRSGSSWKSGGFKPGEFDGDTLGGTAGGGGGSGTG